MIELYDLAGADPALRFSPYCWRARLALAHKGLAPQTLPWRFSDMPRLPGAPLNRLVPVMVDDGEIVSGSTDIAFHLEARYPKAPSLFGGPAGEAHARFIIAWADLVSGAGVVSAGRLVCAFMPGRCRPGAFPARPREPRLGMTLEAARDAAPARLAPLRASLAPLRRVLETQSFLGGEAPSYADYAVFGMFQWVRCAGVPEVLAEDDPLVGWRAAVLGLFGGLAERAPTAGRE